MGGHTAASHPITHVEDSQSIGFWEIRCDPNADFWEELDKAQKSNCLWEAQFLIKDNELYSRFKEINYRTL